MSFELRVEFTGLCMYLVHVDAAGTEPPAEPLDARKVTVVIPECRMGFVDAKHADKKEGKHHVGYMRLDLATVAGVAAEVPAAQVRAIPDYEVVHRFNNQDLDFGLPPEPSISVTTNLPEFDRFAPTLELRPELFGGAEAADFAVARVSLTGGSLTGEPNQTWRFSDLFNSGYDYSAKFAENLVWQREVDDRDSLTLTLTPFGGGDAQQVTLTPKAGADGKQRIRLKIANLCCENPLQWSELEKGESPDHDDDFKWLYRLMLPPQGQTFETMLQARGGAINEFPVPIQAGPEHGGQGCIGGKKLVSP